MTKKEKFIEKCVNKFGNKFNYTDYIDSKTKIEIFCNIHNEKFYQTPAEHLRGKNGCKSCQNNNLKPKKEKINKTKNLGLLGFIEKAKKTHGDKYDYSLVVYKKSDIKINIICPIHGEFEQFPYSHLRGKGCSKCGNNKRKNILTHSTEEFIQKAKKIHGDKYAYSLVEYVNSQEKIDIICNKHGIFSQLPYDHLSNHGCHKCTTYISKQEIEIVKFLENNCIKCITSSMCIIKPNQLDIFIPTHNIAIEFNRLYWHSELYKPSNYHLNKTELCEAKGIQLIHIFEDEWIYKQDIVKSRLINLFGLTPNKIYGRKTEIREVTSKESKIFLDNNHIQGNVNSSVNFGLYYNNELVSIMCFNKPRLGIGNSYDGYELSRFCNKLNTNVIGGADKLLKHFIKIHQPKEIVSYADRRWSQGNLYEKLGFIKKNINKPNYSYIINKTRKHRFGFRKDILKKEGFDINNKTEHEIMLEGEYIGFMIVVL